MFEDSSRLLVCIVDDEPVNIHILSNALEEEYNICVATDGESALNLIRRENPELVLLDVMMPGMNGIEVCRQLKAEEKTSKIPVIFVTALEDVESENSAFEAGGADFISKPISPAIVKARVGRILNVKLYADFLEAVVVRRDQSLEQLREEVELLLDRTLS
jgi:putative two-component system response regulator